MGEVDCFSERELISLQLSVVEFKYLEAFVRLQDVGLMADEARLSERSIRFHLKSIDWAIRSVLEMG